MSRHLAVVVHRYGPEVDGGSEALARRIAHGLGRDDEVEVWTSCARDYLSWRNELPPGDSRDGPVTVRRFPVDRPRRIRWFGRLTQRLVAGPHTRANELDWMVRQGPRVVGLVEALRREGRSFDAVLFFTYLYYPAFFGLPEVADRAVLVPTAHDEPPLYFRIFEDLFAAAPGFVFQTPEERDLVRRRFSIQPRAETVAGVSLRAPERVDADSFRRKFGLEGPLVLCVGRVDRVKGSVHLAEAFLEYRARGGEGTLVFLGIVRAPMPSDPAIRCLRMGRGDGQVERSGAADVSVIASPYESLSLAFLESAAVGTPVLAYGVSAVLAGQCARFGVGMTFADWAGFPTALDSLMKDPARRRLLGANGRASVAALPGWDAVLDSYRAVIDGVRRS
ncbi:MAG: glycosyltransferase family 4 protein [Deltaproteobacteria bacterium]|nr:glycosyltransferase family 4 protein [Deltaproteobacteria bacterium]